MVESITDKVLRTIRGHGLGWVFSPAYFSNIGSRSAVESALRRLKKEGVIRNIARGLYDYPRRVGILAPSLDRIVKALETRDAVRLQPSGAYAANILGISNQMPMKLFFLTDGPMRKLQVGNRTILLKHTTPKNMVTAGRISGTVFQALRWLGKDNLDDNVIAALNDRLTSREKTQLLADIKYAPVWVAQVIRDITGEGES